jgi:exopolyphosphatase/guanosine-5'-triphosphate,3'-diphosphate pyrophosphatase
MTIPPQIGAGVDLGSHTFRLLIAEWRGGKFTVLAKKMATVGLGRGLEKDGLLQEESMQRGLAALQRFRETLEHCRPPNLRVCGTEALRRAKNSRTFLEKAGALLGQPVEIISGVEEARLSLAGVLAAWPEPLAGPLLLADVGGASTELILANSAAEVVRAASVDLGAVTLAGRFPADGSPDAAGLDGVITEALAGAVRQLAPLPPVPLSVIGSGGSATSMAALALNLPVYDERLVHGFTLEVPVIAQLWKTLAELTAAERNALPCLGEGRGEILPAGIRVYLALLRLLQQERMRVSDTGLLEGIMRSSLSRLQT